MRAFLLQLSAISGAILMTATAHAIPAAPSGITLSPFQQQLSLAPDDGAKSYDLRITNNTGALQELKLSSRDFGSLNDTGGVLLEGSTEYAHKYGLVSWLNLGTDTVLLQPGESRAVPITIENRSSLQPGGHYGAVVASVNSLDDKKDNRVIVNQQLLSLLFVKKIGGEHYNLALKRIEHNGNWLHLPNDVKLRFQNPGNIHVVPRGTVTLKSPAGKTLAQGIINSESAFILPETFRELYVPLHRVGSSLQLPGLYHLEVSYRYDGINQAAQKNSALNYVSLPTYALGFVLVVFGGLISRRFWRSKPRPQ